MKTSNKTGNKLTQLRGNRTLEAVAADLQITPASLEAYEIGRRIPRDEIKIRICNYYGVSIDELFLEGLNTRNIYKQAEAGAKRLSPRRDLHLKDLQELWDMALSSKEGIYNALTTAFNLGFYHGYEQRRTEKQ